MEIELKNIPKCYEDYLKFQNLTSWPIEITSEGPMGIESEGLLLGTEEDIVKQLYDAGPFSVKRFEKIERDLAVIEESIRYYSDYLVTDDKHMQWLEGRLQRINAQCEKAFLTELIHQDSLTGSVCPSSSTGYQLQEEPSKMFTSLSSKHHTFVKSDLDELSIDSRRRIENCVFPGFRHGELVELPGQLEAPPILNRVTKAQDFNTGFKKFWRKVFLSEASVAVMQDLFWWFFLHLYRTKMKADQDKLFDRIADSFCALFVSINPDVKDKFFEVYPDCLAQAVYTAFSDAFPESKDTFDSNFMQILINLVNEWTSGTKRPPGQWKNWNIRRLELKGPPKPDGQICEGSQTIHRSSSQIIKNKDINFDMDGVKKTIESLGAEKEESMVKLKESGIVAVTAAAPVIRPQVSRISNGATHYHKGKESHQVGPGCLLERVKFNLNGLSPLLTHYMYKNDHTQNVPAINVRRTEIVAYPIPSGTYQQLIDESISSSDKLKREYHKICEMIEAKIKKLEYNMALTHREINDLQRQLCQAKSSQEIKTLKRKVRDMKDRNKDHGMKP